MKIFNFPPFLYGGKAKVYIVDKVTIEENDEVLRIHINGSREIDYAETPFLSTILSLDYLNKLIENNNAEGVLVKRTILNPRFEKEEDYIFIYLYQLDLCKRKTRESGKSEKVLMRYLSLNKEISEDTLVYAYAILAYPENCEEIFTSISNKLAKFIIEDRKRANYYNVAFMSKSWRIDRYSTYVLYLSQPVQIVFDKFYEVYSGCNNKLMVYIGLASLDLVTKMVGSIIVYRIRDIHRQVPFIVYTPGFKARVGREGSDISPIHVLTNSIAFVLHIRVSEELLNELVSIVENHIINALNILKNENELNELENSIKKSLDRDHRIRLKDLKIIISNSQVRESSYKTGTTSISIDPKALLKALFFESISRSVHSSKDFFKISQIQVCNNTCRSDEELPKEANRCLRRFTRSNLKCLDEIERLKGDIAWGDKTLACFSTVKRFEEQLYSIVERAIRCRSRGKGDINDCLIYAILYHALKNVLTSCRQLLELLSGRVNEELKLVIEAFIDVEEMAKNIALRYLELNFHGLLHVFRRTIALELNTSEGDFGELLIIGSNKYDGNVFIDNCLLRRGSGIINLRSESLSGNHIDIGAKGDLYVFLIVYMRNPHTYPSLHVEFSANNGKKLKDLAKRFNELLYDLLINPEGYSKCYFEWLDHAQKVRSVFSSIFLIKSPMSDIKINTFENDIMNLAIEGYPFISRKTIDPGNPLSVRRMLYLPLSDLRRLVIRNFRDYLTDKLKIYDEKERSNMLLQLKVLMPLILEYYTPRCFDGCYACVLSKYCEVRNPLMRDWVASKDFYQFIANLMNKCGEENKHEEQDSVGS
ncbi:MAG: hypothetical protein ABWW65_05155 [Thermoprotei archaeon]